MLLVKFLYRNLKGYRFLVVLAIVVAVPNARQPGNETPAELLESIPAQVFER